MKQIPRSDLKNSLPNSGIKKNINVQITCYIAILINIIFTQKVNYQKRYNQIEQIYQCTTNYIHIVMQFCKAENPVNARTILTNVPLMFPNR